MEWSSWITILLVVIVLGVLIGKWPILIHHPPPQQQQLIISTAKGSTRRSFSRCQ